MGERLPKLLVTATAESVLAEQRSAPALMFATFAPAAPATAAAQTSRTTFTTNIFCSRLRTPAVLTNGPAHAHLMPLLLLLRLPCSLW